MQGLGISPEALKAPQASSGSGWKPEKRKSDKSKKDDEPPSAEKKIKVFDLETGKADYKKAAKGYVQTQKAAKDKLVSTTEATLESLQQFEWGSTPTPTNPTREDLLLPEEEEDLGTGPSEFLGQARSWDRPFKILGTSPLLGHAL